VIHIQHRTNTIAELQQTPKAYGVEIDIRNHGDDLLVVHDPFLTDAVNLADWLAAYDHAFLIANVKEEGLEPRLLKLLADNNVHDFFILDESIPFIRKYALEGVSNFALRVSEFESVETALNLNANLKAKNCSVEWIWMDTFTGAPLAPASIRALKSAGFKLCQVSPELHHVNEVENWKNLIATFQAAQGTEPDLRPDMVCTKRPGLW